MKYAAAAIVVLGVACALATWQFGLVRRDLSSRHDAIQTAWEQVDDDLKTRAELVPRLSALLKKLARPDPDALQRAADASEEILDKDSVAEKITAYTDLNTALMSLLGAAHRSPALLKRNDFHALEYELESTENRIARSRSLYNDAVKKYNTKLRLFPGNLVAYLSSYRPETAYFKTEVASGPPNHP